MVEILNRDIENFHDLPFIGPWPAKVGKVLRLWASPCSPSAEIWVQAFWHDIPFLVWAFIKPESWDLVSERFGTGHHRKRRKKFHVLDVFQPKFPVPKGAIGWAVFPVVQASERIGLYLLVVDASLDFVINWTSTAYTWEGCDVEDAAWATGRAQDATLILPPFDFGGVPCFTVNDAYKFASNFSYIDTIGNYDVTYNCSISYTTPPPGNAFHFDGTFQVRDFENGWLMDEAKGARQPDGTYLASMGVRDWSATKPRHTYGFVALCDHVSHVNFNGTVHNAYGHKQKGMKFDP